MDIDWLTILKDWNADAQMYCLKWIGTSNKRLTDTDVPTHVNYNIILYHHVASS